MSQSRVDTFHAHLGSANAVPRPLLTSLNGDNSWLISFPRPASERARSGSKAYFHIVSDPWLSGHVELITSWVMTIRTEEAAAVPSGAAVEGVIQEIENAAASANLITSSTPNDAPATTEQPPLLDAIFLNFHYADHVNEETLRTFHHGIPVFATPEAAAIVRRWAYFTHITETLDLDPAAPAHSWPSLHPGGGLPDWLSVFRLPGHAELNFATAIVYSSSSSSSSSSEEGKKKKTTKKQHEALLYAPHGIKTDQAALTTFLANLEGSNSNPEPDDSEAESSARVSVLAILHTLKDHFAFGMRHTLGVAGGLALERLARPRYWVKSHDAPLSYTGLLPFVGRSADVLRTLQDGLDEEDKAGGGVQHREERKRPNLVEVTNGACFVLV